MTTTFDAVGPSGSGQQAAGATSLTLAHTCAADATQILAGIAFGGADGSVTVTATYNGASLTSLGKVHANNQTSGFIEVFEKRFPSGTDGASHNVVFTVSGNAGDLEGCALSFKGSDTATAPTAVTAFGSSGTSNPGAVTSDTDSMVAAFHVAGNVFNSTNGTQRCISNQNTNSGGGNMAANTIAGSASTTITASLTSDWWGAIGVNVAAAVVTLDGHIQLEDASGNIQLEDGSGALVTEDFTGGGGPPAFAAWGIPL